MKPNSRDLEIMKRIIGYCGEINNTLERVRYDFDTMMSDFLYKNSLAMIEPLNSYCRKCIEELEG